MKKPLVSVVIITYNHGEYISQAIEGALMQKTDFDYEILVGEDDSTDQTREICKKYAAQYPKKIRLFLNDRKNVIYINGLPTGRWNFINLLKNSTGKYIALCEGDDYWIDKYKIQRQYDFLEKNPDYGLVHTDSDKYFEKTGQYICSANSQSNVLLKSGNIYENLLTYNYTIDTCTMFFRRNLVMDLLQDSSIWEYPAADLIFQAHLAKKSLVKYMNISTVVRRHTRMLPIHKIDLSERSRFHASMLDFRENHIQKNQSLFAKKNLICFEKRKCKILLLDGFYIKNQQKIRLAYQRLKELNASDKKDSLYFLSSRSPWLSSLIKRLDHHKLRIEVIISKIRAKRHILPRMSMMYYVRKASRLSLNTKRSISPKKIFCLSFQRTGTTSVAAFLDWAGYKVTPWSVSRLNKWGKKWYEKNYDKIFESFDFRFHTAFQDSPWFAPNFYEVLLNRFPDAKFILMRRNSNDWFQSMLRHSNEKNPGNTKIHCHVYRRDEEYQQYMLDNPNRVEDLDSIDNLFDITDYRDHYIRIYEDHYNDAVNYFNKKSPGSLFHCNLEDNDKWVRIGKFLGVHVPVDITFHSNKSKTK